MTLKRIQTKLTSKKVRTVELHHDGFKFWTVTSERDHTPREAELVARRLQRSRDAADLPF